MRYEITGSQGKTEDALATTLSHYSLPSNATARFIIVVAGRSETVKGNSFTARLDYSFIRDGLTNVALLGAEAKIIHSVGATGWDVNLIASGKEVLIQVTGVIGEVISWGIDGDVFVLDLF